MGKSPQVILNEKTIITATNNTSDTAVAIIGYARNGEINKPILCTNLKEFKETFGGIPETAPWSTMSAYRAFNYCNKVYYVRVADESIAQKAEYVIRNASPAKPSTMTLNQEYSFSAGTFEADKDYAFKVGISNDSGTSYTDYNIYLHSPAEGDWEVEDLASQILKGFQPFYNYQDAKSKNLNIATAGKFYLPLATQASETSTKIFEINLYPNSTINDLVVALNTAFASGSINLSVYSVTNTSTTPLPGQHTYKLYYSLDNGTNFLEKEIALISDTSKADVAELINAAFASIISETVGLSGSVDFAYQGDYITFINKTNQTIILKTKYEAGDEQDNIIVEAFGANDEPAFISDSTSIGQYVEAIEVNGKLRIRSIFADKVPSTTFLGYDAEKDVYFPNKVSSVVNGFYALVAGQYIPETIETYTYAKQIPCSAEVVGNKVMISTLDGSANILLRASNFPASEQYSNFYDLSIFTDCAYTDEMTTITAGKGAEEYYNHDNIYFTAKNYGTANAGENGVVIEQVRNTDVSGKEVIKINVYYNKEVVETYNNVSLNPNETDPEKIYFATAINNSPENGGSKYVSVKVVRPATPVSTDVEFPEGTYVLGKGKVSYEDDANAYDYKAGNDGIPTSNPRKSGISLFTKVLGTDGELANTEVYNYHILATPDNGSQVVQDKAMALCEATGESFYLVDPPQGLAYNEVVKYENGEGNFGRNSALNSSYEGIFHDWLMDYDEDNENYVWCPPSVFILELLLRNDKQYGCWYAPAGDNRGNITAADYASSPSLSQRDYMYGENTVNPIVNFSSKGLELYGEKTCLRSETSPMSRIHVRRMAIYIKKLIKNALQGFLFEANSPANWARMVSIISQVLEPIKQQDGIDQYMVQIDSSTMSEADLANSTCRGVVKIVPMGSMEVIELSVIYGSFGASIEEL